MNFQREFTRENERVRSDLMLTWSIAVPYALVPRVRRSQKSSKSILILEVGGLARVLKLALI